VWFTFCWLQIRERNRGEHFALTNNPYRFVHGVILIYDITNMESFKALEAWLSEVERYAREDVCKLLVGNKCDLLDEHKVPYEIAKEFAQFHNLIFFETSAKDSLNVERVFHTLAQNIKTKFQQK
jgi:Ras-related protein Rab-1A